MKVKEEFFYQSEKVSQLADLIIDDNLCTDIFWVLEENDITGQLGFRTEIDLNGVSKGFHVLTMVDKNKFSEGHSVLFVIPFYKK